MRSSKSFFISIFRPICRLISCTLWQLPWFGVIAGGVWWYKQTLPVAIQHHFGLDQADLSLQQSLERVRILKGMTSFSNPGSLVSYLSALFDRTSANAKYTSLQMIAGTAETVTIWALDLIFILACVYAVYRIYKAFRADTQKYHFAKSIVNQINPNIEALHSQITLLQQEIDELKNELHNKK
ncbi:MAG: hypothetical protein J6Y85_02735 [Alphaproteobacteria bacterium]|nr:hypothetical protein [Alphaproteobacteria bacterium]